jgi:predicted nucleotidyltransferase
MQIRCKDFIETAEGLIFAVLADDPEEDRHLCFLRYIKTETGYRKVETEEANRLLAADFPRYRFHSLERDADLHGVPRDTITRHHRPIQKLHEIVSAKYPDPIESKLASIVNLLETNGLCRDHLGITGSLLIGAQTARSDIDLVIYDREHFDRLRAIVRQGFVDKSLDRLGEAQWREAYRRRGCSLSLEEYRWHERRKYNKASLSGTRIDFSLVSGDTDPERRSTCRKIKTAEIIAEVTDARLAFDHPARYRISHPEIGEIASFTPTFAGQALAGETVIARGILEESERGTQRLVIGSSREAPGEYIKVVRSAV